MRARWNGLSKHSSRELLGACLKDHNESHGMYLDYTLSKVKGSVQFACKAFARLKELGCLPALSKVISAHHILMCPANISMILRRV